jgi:hypothetical protein
MVSKRQQRRTILADRISSRGLTMVYPCTSCSKSGKKCIVDQSSKLCSECARYSRRCDIDRVPEIERLDAEEKRLLSAAEEADTEVSRLLDQLQQVSSRARRLRKQADFLGGRVKKIVKGELDGLEAVEKLSPDIANGMSTRAASDVPASSPTESEFWSLLGPLGTPEAFRDNA